MAGKYINIDSTVVTIYGLVSNQEPNNIKYVGITRRKPSYRLNSHIFESRKKPEKNSKTKWISQNNFNIKQIILDEVQNFTNLKLLEEHWISLVKSWGFSLVNSNNGGGGFSKRDDKFSLWLSNRNLGNKYNLGKKRSDETKALLSISHIGILGANKGKKFNSDWIYKLRQAKIGKPSNAKGFKHTEETKNKKRKTVFQIDENNIILNEFKSVSETANFFNVSISTISKILNKNKKYNGCIFETKIKNNG